MFRLVRSQSGSTMLVVICLFLLIGALVTAGVSIIGPQVKRGKINDTKTKLDSAVDAVISWSVRNGRIPISTEYQSILPDPDDAWGKPLLYLYDGRLADTAAAGYGGLCGVPPSATYNGIAFVLVSGGDDFSIESTPNPSGAFVSFPLPIAPTLQSSDIYRSVTLEELQSRAGCSGTTKGRLRIVNNEIPNGCSGKYKVTLYADGGVTTNYSWLLLSATPSPPTWTPAPQPQSGSFAVFSSSTTPLGASNKLTFQLINVGQATVQRTYNLKTTTCGGCAGYRVWSNTGVQNDFMLGLCRGNINSSSEVTNGTPELVAGGTITRYTKAGNCKAGWDIESITYAQAVSADVNGNCQVNYGPGGIVTDR